MKRIPTVHGKIRHRKFLFSCRVNGQRIANVILDTGAFDFILSEKVAKQLGLSRNQAVTVRGVSGTTRAWTSRCRLAVGKTNFGNVPCAIIQGLPYDALFGLGFFIDRDFQLLLNPKTATLSFVR